MLNKTKERPSLLRYWTTRYFLTLCIGLLLVGVISTMWIRHNNTEKRLDILEMTAEEIAGRITDTSGRIPPNVILSKVIEDRFRFLRMEGRPLIYVLDETGNIVFGIKDGIFEKVDFRKWIQNTEMDNIQMIELSEGESFYLVKKEILLDEQQIGWVFILLQKREIQQSPDEMKLLLIMLISLAVLGWAVIYFLSKKLLKPVSDVAGAAQQIVDGNYNVQLDHKMKEKEMHELIFSFKEMASRLQQLESLRTELLAGVTHELKTPVTAISGLIQAVQEGVVTGEEAKQFLAISQKEIARLQKLVEDLLDFNSFAAGKVRISKEMIHLNKTLQEIIQQWKLMQENVPHIQIKFCKDDISIFTDPSRLQQIFINLLNNAQQACVGECCIDIHVYCEETSICMDVKDNGIGIPAEEQDLIFERFFRGHHKKHQVHGLGLGLPYSKMIARALGGDLFLKESTEQGTTFTVTLPNQSTE